MWTIFKVSIKFVTILFLFYVLVFWSWGIWDLSSPTRDWTHSRTPCIEKWSLSHWTTREAPLHPFQCLDSHLSLGWKNKSRNYRLLALCLFPSDKCFFPTPPLVLLCWAISNLHRDLQKHFPKLCPFSSVEHSRIVFPSLPCSWLWPCEWSPGQWKVDKIDTSLLGLSKAICTQLCSRPQSGFCEWFEALGDGGALDRCLGSWKTVQRCMSSSQLDAHWNVDSA